MRPSGLVHDESGPPIEGAEIQFTIPVTWSKLANYAFHGADLVTVTCQHGEPLSCFPDRSR